MENKTRNRILLVLFFGVLMGALDIAIVGPAMPAIQRTYSGITERSLAWIFSAYVLFNLVGTPIMAKLSDLYGRRIIYIVDVSLFALGSLIVAFAPGFNFILLGRAVQGFGAGGIFPVASAVIGDTFPAEKRGTALGLIGAVFGLAFIVGPILAGVILSITTWHWLFLINLPIALLLILFSARLLPSVRTVDRAVFDWSGMIVLSLMLGAMTFGLNQIDTARFFASLISLDVLPYLAAAIALGLILVQVERRASNPILPAVLFGSRQLKLGYFLSAGAGVGESAIVFMPLLAVAALTGIQENQASFLLMPVVLAMAVGSPLVGRLLDRIGSKLVILTGLVILGVGVFLLSQFASSMFLFIVSGVLIGLGMSTLLGAPIRYITLNEVSAENRSTAQGAVTVFTSIGQLVGAALVGAVAASRGGGVEGYSTGFLVIAMLSVMMIAAAVGLKPRRDELKPAAPSPEPSAASQPKVL